MPEKTKPYQDFTSLEVWKYSRSFQMEVFELCKTFPGEEKFRLADQLIRSARSIAANISEGHGRYHYQEQIQFCRQARGSLSETVNHLITAYDCKYINKEVLVSFKLKTDQMLKLINGYLRFLKNEKLTQSTQSTKSTNKPTI
jgi:four helix bundle protein